MFTVGITGGIGTGKTTLAEFLRIYGAIEIDADKIARVVIERPEIREALVNEFGTGILNKDKEIDRKVLARQVFNDEVKLNKLNKIMLPQITEVINNNLELFSKTMPPNQVIVIDAPLLVKSGLDKVVDLIVFVQSEYENRLERLTKKGFTVEEAKMRIEGQSEAIEEDKAGYIIKNDGTMDELKKRSKELWQEITHLASF